MPYVVKYIKLHEKHSVFDKQSKHIKELLDGMSLESKIILLLELLVVISSHMPLAFNAHNHCLILSSILIDTNRKLVDQISSFFPQLIFERIVFFIQEQLSSNLEQNDAHER